MFNAKILSRCLLALILFSAIGCSKKETPSNQAVVAANQSVAAAVPSVKPTLHYCPQISELIKTDLIWTTKDGKWKSHEQSFAKEVASFKGAQWVGIVVGQVLCLYKGKESFDFPIALEATQTFLVPEPQEKNWVKTSPGYRTCVSNNIADCSFIVQKENTAENVYEEIRYKKKDTSDQIPL